jgi:hypothetical protein
LKSNFFKNLAFDWFFNFKSHSKSNNFCISSLIITKQLQYTHTYWGFPNNTKNIAKGPMLWKFLNTRNKENKQTTFLNLMLVLPLPLAQVPTCFLTNLIWILNVYWISNDKDYSKFIAQHLRL